MAHQIISFTVFKVGERLDKLAHERLPDLSRSQVQSLIKKGLITVDGSQVKAGIKLRGGEEVVIELPERTPDIIEPEDIPLDIVFEDDSIAVINKTANMVVHPGVGNETGTLTHAILWRWPQIDAMDDPDQRRGIVHRLDKDTSGLIVVAKTADALHDLMTQFQERTVDKSYIALLERTPKTRTGVIEAPIARDPKQRKRMAVSRDGKAAVSEFTVVDDNFRDGQALTRFKLITGRTHQIRVHAAFIGCPVVGDTVYGFRKQRIRMKRNFLHAEQIAFDHPDTGVRVSFEAPMPVGLLDIMAKLRPA